MNDKMHLLDDITRLRHTIKTCLEALEEYQNMSHPAGVEGAQRAALAMQFARADLQRS